MILGLMILFPEGEGQYHRAPHHAPIALSKTRFPFWHGPGRARFER